MTAPQQAETDVPSIGAQRTEQKPATAARIYDYLIGGTHNFPADRAAAQAAIERVPLIPIAARANRAFLGRAVRVVAEAGVRQFLDIGSGIPTEGNVHEIAHEVAPDARVVYVDIDPVAVSEGLEILEGNDHAIAIRGNLTDTSAILSHPDVIRLIDFSQPVALLLCAVLHFVPNDDEALAAVARLRAQLCPGSYLVISHATPPDEAAQGDVRSQFEDDERAVKGVYNQQTATPFQMRNRAEIMGFFDGLDMIEPGLVWVPEWRPSTAASAEFDTHPEQSAILAGVATRR